MVCVKYFGALRVDTDGFHVRALHHVHVKNSVISKQTRDIDPLLAQC